MHDYTVLCGETTQGTCNCGVAVKVGDDVLKISRCPQDIGSEENMLNKDFPTGVFLYKNGDLSPGFRILKSSKGFKVSFYAFVINFRKRNTQKLRDLALSHAEAFLKSGQQRVLIPFLDKYKKLSQQDMNPCKTAPTNCKLP